MTVISTDARAAVAGNGVTTSFPFAVSFGLNSDIRVYHLDATGVATLWTEGLQYTLTGAGNATGGTVTTQPGYTPASGTTLVISRWAEAVQPIDLQPNAALPADTLEGALDRLTRIAQQILAFEFLGLRSNPATDPSAGFGYMPAKASMAGKFLAFDSGGNPIASDGTASLGPTLGGFNWAGTTGGTASAMTAAPVGVSAYTAGLAVLASAGFAASGSATTLNVNGLGARSVQDFAGSTPAANLWAAGELLLFVYTGSVFRVANVFAGVRAASNITMSSTDATNNPGPTLTLDRNSASPAASDQIGRILFQGRDIGAGVQTYADVVCEITDTLAGSEDARLLFRPVTNGSNPTAVRIGPGAEVLAGGLSVGSSAALPGDGYVNVQNGYQRGGLQLPFQRAYVSATTVIAANNTYTFAHGLGTVPLLVFLTAECATAEAGYSVGDHIVLSNVSYYTTSAFGPGMYLDSTNVVVLIQNNSLLAIHPHKSTRVSTGLNVANWKLIVRAFA